MRRSLIAAGAALVSLAFVAPAPAQAPGSVPGPQAEPGGQAVPCGPRDTVLKTLEDIGEVPVGVGLAGADDKAVIELTVAPDGTWSVLVSNTDGLTCLVLAGEAWDFARPEPDGEES